MTSDVEGERSRGTEFPQRSATKICKEIASPDNPFLAQRTLWHGHDVADLMRHCDLVDVVFLLLKGDLPSVDDKRLLQQLLIALANPGPRHAATRSVMSAAVFKTRSAQFLPIGMALMSGENRGSCEVEAAMRFLVRNATNEPASVAEQLIEQRTASPDDGRFAPGFGQMFGGCDPFTASIAELLIQEHPHAGMLCWAQRFVDGLGAVGAGWLMSGLAAAVFVELGFRPMVGAGLYQMAASPGLLAHGVEMSNKPVTAMPFVADENYHYEGVADVEAS
jgi:citrate synthase